MRRRNERLGCDTREQGRVERVLGEKHTPARGQAKAATGAQLSANEYLQPVLLAGKPKYIKRMVE